MNNNKLDSVVFMWISFGLTLLAVLMMFVPAFIAEGQTYNAISGFFNSESGTYKGAWPAFIGYMLILAGGLATGVLALPTIQPSYGAEKLTLLIASVLEAIGIFLVMMCVVWWCLLNYGNVDYVTHSGYHLHAGSYICGSLSILAILCNIRALFLDR